MNKKQIKTDVLTQLLSEIKEIRCFRAMTQNELAKKLNISQNAYSKIEKGRTNLQLTVFLAVCEILEIEPAELMKQIADKNKK